MPNRSPFKVVHVLDESVTALWQGTPVVRYHYNPEVDQRETPKPFVHPLATPRGEVLSLDRPHDHVWHRGLYFGWSHVNDHNFWGGPSFVDGEGYVQKENNGSMVHDTWEQLTATGERTDWIERLTWHDVRGTPWINERRRFSVEVPVEDSMLLTVETRLSPVSGAGPFTFGSPLTDGRPNAGYSGLTLRMPRSFTGGECLLSSGEKGTDLMGRRGNWLYFAGKVDETAVACGVAIFDHPNNLRHPTHFFVRTTPFAILNPAFCWNEEYVLHEEEPLNLTYGVWIHAGDASKKRVDKAYTDWVRSTAGEVF